MSKITFTEHMSATYLTNPIMIKKAHTYPPHWGNMQINLSFAPLQGQVLSRSLNLTSMKFVFTPYLQIALQSI